MARAELSMKQIGDDVTLNPAEQKVAVEEFRKLIKQDDWLNVPRDEKFLLSFLRSANFKQDIAKEILKKNWDCRSRFKNWFSNVDPSDEVIQSVIKDGQYVICPQPDKQGRRVVILRSGIQHKLLHEDGDSNIDVVYKALCLVQDYLAADEIAQTKGIVFLVDLSDITSTMENLPSLQHSQANNDFFSITLQGNLPYKVKVVHIYKNPDSFLMWTLLFSEEDSSMVQVHGDSLQGIYDDVGMDILPDEYLPLDYTGTRAGTCDKMIDVMIDGMTRPDFKNFIKNLSSINFNTKSN